MQPLIIALKYGPEIDLFKNNPHLSRPVCEGPDEYKSPPHLVDLAYLLKQDFASDIKKLKRYFLTACVPPQDRHLLLPPQNNASIQLIESIIRQIVENLNMPWPSSKNQHVLTVLKIQILRLFQQRNWMGVGIGMVDKNELDIDILSTLVVWQAACIQYGRENVELTVVEKSRPLEGGYASDYDGEGLNNCSLFDLVCADCKPEGIIPSPSCYREIKLTYSILRYPSVKLLQNYLHASTNNGKGNYLLLFYSFGLPTHHDFLVAAFFGGRILQLYLPNGQGNLLKGHGSHLGEAGMTQHDYFHVEYSGALLPSYSSETDCLLFMRGIAVIVNAWTRLYLENQSQKLNTLKLAQDLNDEPHFSWFSSQQHEYWRRFSDSEKKMIIYQYIEYFCEEAILAAELELKSMQISMQSNQFNIKLTVNKGELSFSLPKWRESGAYDDNSRIPLVIGSLLQKLIVLKQSPSHTQAPVRCKKIKSNESINEKTQERIANKI